MSQILTGFFASFSIIFACCMTYLVLTKKVVLPLLLELGMAVAAVGVLLVGEGVETGAGGLTMALRSLVVSAGGLLIWASSRREKKKRARSDPRDLTNDAMRHVNGGKR